LVRLLISNGSEIDARDERGRTPLYMTTEQWGDKLENVNVLLDAGADIDLQDNNGTTPLMNAIFYGYTEVAQTLIRRGAKLDIRDTVGRHVLYTAASNGPSSLLKEIVIAARQVGVDINSKDNTGSTPLMSAVGGFRGDACVEVCIDEGADVNAQDHDGRTVVSFLAGYNWSWDGERYKAQVERLVKAGADINLADNNGKTPLDHFQARGIYSPNPFEFFEGLGAQRGIASGADSEGVNSALNGGPTVAGMAGMAVPISDL